MNDDTQQPSTIREAAEQVEKDNQTEETEIQETQTDDSPEKSETDVSDKDTKKDEVSDVREKSQPSEPQFDPLSFVDNLKDIPDDQKKRLKDGYLRQADYTKKTQELSQVRKEYETLKKLQPYIEKIVQNPELSKQVFGVQKPAEPELPDDPKEFLRLAEDRGAAKAIQFMREQQAREQAFNTDLQQSLSLDPRLQSDEKFGALIGNMVLAQQDAIKSGQKTITQATQEALVSYAEYEKGLQNKFVEELTNKAKNKQMAISKSGKTGAVTGDGKQPQSIREAFEQIKSESDE